MTWSVFGTAAKNSQARLEVWLAELLALLDLPDIHPERAEVFLWRRIPHPDTLVPGKPEIDIGILSTDALVVCETKWLSGVGAAQGKKKDKDQIQLRGEFQENTLLACLLLNRISLSLGSACSKTPS